MRMLATIFSLMVAIFAIGSLIYSPSYVDFVFPGGLPPGNLLAASGLCSLITAALLLSQPNTAQHKISKILLLASILWLPVSAVLAGNLSLNFQGVRGTVWLFGSIFLVSAVLLMLAWALGNLLLRVYKQRRAA